jgi:hypothetical protein
MKSVPLIFVLSCLPAAAQESPPPQVLGFDLDAANSAPKGSSCSRTGEGRPGVWRVIRDGSAPSQPHALGQMDADATGYRFPLCVFDQTVAMDVDLSVRIKPVSGREDQAGGLVWRYRDPDNYYVARVNALEDNVVLYKVERGHRKDLKARDAGFLSYGKKVDVPAGAWSSLRVTVRGSVFVVHFNDQQLLEVEDSTFPGPGKIGVWTKADSVTYFDDLTVAVNR